MCREMKDSGIEWIGKIPKEWEVIRTKNIYSNPKSIVGDKADNYDRLALTLNGVIKRSKEDSNGLQPEKFEGYQILKENELVFKLIDLENVATSRVGLSPYTGLVSPAYIILDNEEHSKFGYYYFISMYYQQIFNKLGGDGVRSNLNAKDLLNIPYLNIIEEERIKISNYLDKKVFQINDIISKQKILIEKYKAYKQSIITETVTKGLKKNVPMKDSGIEWIGEIPNHWGICKLNNVVSFFNGDRGKNYPNENEYVIEGIPFINAGNLENGRISFNNMKYISLSKYNSMGGAKIQVNDIVYCLRGTIGKNAFVTELDKATVASSLMVIRADKIFARFLFYILNSNIEKIQNKFSENGTAQPNLSAQSVGNYITILPNKKEQMEIADFLDKKCNTIDFTISKKEQLIEKLEEYKKSLIYECVTGKREVN